MKLSLAIHTVILSLVACSGSTPSPVVTPPSRKAPLAANDPRRTLTGRWLPAFAVDSVRTHDQERLWKAVNRGWVVGTMELTDTLIELYPDTSTRDTSAKQADSLEVRFPSRTAIIGIVDVDLPHAWVNKWLVSHQAVGQLRSGGSSLKSTCGLGFRIAGSVLPGAS